MKLRHLRPELDAKHRPWALPKRPWIMTQTWHNLLFAHWACDPALLRAHVPADVRIDTFEGKAWLGVVAFRLSAIRLRGTPEIGLVSHFNEINLRTYVTYGSKPGVLFLSMDADNPLAISLAKPWFRLPYTAAEMSFDETSRGYRLRSEREGDIEPPAVFDATYRPMGKIRRAEPGSLAQWLTERYCYYTESRGRLYRCEINHPQWPLQPASACIESNSLAASLGIQTETCAPLLHYSHKITAVIWPLERIGR